MDRQDDLEDRVREAASDMERGADEMESRKDEVGERVERTSAEWKRKQQDSQVPGADPGEDADAEEEVAGDFEGEGPAAQDAGQ
jgi:hypothetical protein